MSCTICNHPQRQEIDQALVTGAATLVALAHQYGLSKSALHRHKAHLQAKISRAQGRLRDTLRQGCLFWLSQALEMTRQTAQAAQADGNGKLVLQAVSQGTRLLTIILKQDIQLDDTVIYEILASPEWATQGALLPHEPNIMAKYRQSLSQALSSPCPDTPPPASSPASPKDLELELDALQSLLSSLGQPSAAQPVTENRHFKKREKSGKLPGKIPALKGNNNKNQEDKLYEKIAGIMDLSSLARPIRLETHNSKLDTIFEDLAKSEKIPTDRPLSEYIYEQSLPGHAQTNPCG